MVLLFVDDFRLPPSILDERDDFFYRLKQTIGKVSCMVTKAGFEAT
jgi:hypothetical protein